VAGANAAVAMVAGNAAVAMAAAPPSPSGGSSGGAAGAWSWPLPGAPEVVRPYDPPATLYGRGHRGADLAAPPGSPVLAAGSGVVSFAGGLAGRGVVAVKHPGGLRTTYEPLRVMVRVGQHVERGTVLGTLMPGHPGCPRPACLHWGLLRGPAYLDPLSLLRSGLTRLLPLGERARAGGRGSAELADRVPAGRGSSPAVASDPPVPNPAAVHRGDGSDRLGGPNPTGAFSPMGPYNPTGAFSPMGPYNSMGGSSPMGRSGPMGGANPTGRSSTTGASIPMGGSGPMGGANPTGRSAPMSGSGPMGGANPTGRSSATGASTPRGGSGPTVAANQTVGSAFPAGTVAYRAAGDPAARGTLRTDPWRQSRQTSGAAAVGLALVAGWLLLTRRPP
jgi:hypothetical protein